MANKNDHHDVIIVGAGPAGLSAALILGRCRRDVLVIENADRRNAASRHLHGFLTRDGTNPAELLELARNDLAPYTSVRLHHAEVVDAACVESGFEVTLEGGATRTARKLVLATGMLDELPNIDGFATYFGRGAFVCPYCDGWEVRDQPLIAYGDGDKARRMALELLCWSDNVTLCTDGPSALEQRDLDRCSRVGIQLCEEPIRRLEGDGELHQVVLASGRTLPCRGFFVSPEQRQRAPLIERLGCDLTQRGVVATGDYATTNVPGLYVAGDASRGVQLAIVAAAEGAMAAFAINNDLLREDLR